MVNSNNDENSVLSLPSTRKLKENLFLTLPTIKKSKIRNFLFICLILLFGYIIWASYLL